MHIPRFLEWVIILAVALVVGGLILLRVRRMGKDDDQGKE